MNRISSLLDEILCSILSFVTTKEAVATSVLSKRWTHLWLSVPNLHFTNINIDTTESKLRFNETVYSVLASREAVGSNFINSFRLDIKYTNSNLANDFEWVNLIVQCKLKYLRLRLHVGEYAVICKLPISILTCKTLVSLNLRWFRLEGFSFTSNEFGFPSLKILHLQIMFFLKVRDFMLLLAKCPILEDLQASRMFFYSQEDSLTIHQEFKSLSLPKLTRANITRCFCLYHPGNPPQNPYDGILISYLTTLVLVNARNTSVLQVLHGFPKLQKFELYKGLYMAIGNEEGNQQNWVEPEFVPQCLLSDLKTCTIRDFLSRQSELMLEKYILKNAKILETMTIWSAKEQSEIERKLFKCPKGSATCQLSVYTWPQ